MAGTASGQQDDAEIVAASLIEPEAFSLLFERHSSTVFKFLARQFDPEAARDLLAETFSTAFQIRNRYDTSFPDATPWLLGIAFNNGRHHRRSVARYLRMRDRLHAPAGFTRDETEQADARADALRERARLTAALERLNPAYRAVILLFAAFDLSYEEVARALGIPIGTVRSRLSRARTELRELLGQSGQYQVVDDTRYDADTRDAGDSGG